MIEKEFAIADDKEKHKAKKHEATETKGFSLKSKKREKMIVII